MPIFINYFAADARLLFSNGINDEKPYTCCIPLDWLCMQRFFEGKSMPINYLQYATNILHPAIYMCIYNWLIPTLIHLPYNKVYNSWRKVYSVYGLFGKFKLHTITMCRVWRGTLLYNWLIWRVLKLAFFFKKIFSLYLFWRLEQSEQRHLYVDIFLCDL